MTFRYVIEANGKNPCKALELLELHKDSIIPLPSINGDGAEYPAIALPSEKGTIKYFFQLRESIEAETVSHYKKSLGVSIQEKGDNSEVVIFSGHLDGGVIEYYKSLGFSIREKKSVTA